MRNVLAVLVVAAWALSAAGCGSSSDPGTMGSPTPVGGAMAAATGGTTGGAVLPTGGASGGVAGVTGGAPGAGTIAPPPAGSGGMAAIPMGPCAACPECDANCQYPDIRGTGSCVGLDSGFPGDEACLPAPEPGDGIQIHVGPADYKNVGDYLFPAMLENSQAKNFITPNDADLYYQGWVVSARTGTHHIIDTCYMQTLDPNAPFGPALDPGIGSVPNSFRIPGASKPYMPRSPVAPENASLGAKLPAKSNCQADMHYFNFTAMPVLREMWMNLYTKPQDQIMAEAQGIRGMGGTSWIFAPIPAGSRMVYKYQMPAQNVEADARIVSLLGHYHAHGVRFTAWLNDTKVFEMFDYNDPQIFYYNSVTKNPEFAPELMQPGATSGILSVKAGDILKWECDINNDGPTGLSYTNEVKTGEMCNLWGGAVGAKFDAVLP